MAQAVAKTERKIGDIYGLRLGGFRADADYPSTDAFPELSTQESVCIDLEDGKYEAVKKVLPDECVEQLKHKCKFEIEEKTGHVTFYPSPYLKKDDISNKKLEYEFLNGSKYLDHLLSQINCDQLEAIYDWNAKIIKKQDNIHSFVRCVETAFFDHYPLVLKPCHIQLLINQAIAYHMQLNSEQLREKFVNFQDKMTLIVSRPNFKKGSKDNDWSGVIKEFAQQVDANTVKDTVPLLESDFSTSSTLDVIANKVCVMDICQHYFEYVVMCGCGFPSIKLEGTKQDWVKLKEKASKLLETKLEKSFSEIWSKSLLPVLDQFINAYEGKIDCLFWNSMVQRGGAGGSMGGTWAVKDLTDIRSHISGWINVFFPYLMKTGYGGWGGPSQDCDKNEKKEEVIFNDYCVPYSLNRDYVVTFIGFPGDGPSMKQLPVGMASAPVKYEDIGTQKEYFLKFGAGFVGIKQDENSLAVTPAVGWVVGENTKAAVQK